MKVVLVALLPILCACWWDVGHMLTAAIAEIRMNQLNPYASVKFRELVGSINNLVDNKSRTFIESACWPDDLKARQYNMELWNSWHFINSYVSHNLAHSSRMDHFPLSTLPKPPSSRYT